MKKRVIATLMAAAMTAALLAGCGSDDKGSSAGNDAGSGSEDNAGDDAGSGDEEGSQGSEEKGSGDGYVIGVAMNTQTNPFFVTVVEGCKKAAEEYGIELIVTDAQDDPSIQQKDIENLITKKPDAIIIDTCDSDAIVSSVEDCNAAGIPVFTMDREANGGEVVSHIGYDAIKSGKLAGQFLVDELGGKGKIVELQGVIGTNVAQNRSEGFNSVMAENPDMEIVACQVADFDRAKAMSVMENILQANPEIDGLYAANDEMLLGALEAIQAANRTDEIVKCGCDALDETMDDIREGTVQGTIAEPPFFLGKAIVEAAYDYLNGETIEKSVILDNQLVTKDNVDDIVTKE